MGYIGGPGMGPVTRTPKSTIKARPRLTRETVFDYLEWLADNHHTMVQQHVGTHMQIGELAVRILTTEAQGKTNQHMLVEQGLMEAPTT